MTEYKQAIVVRKDLKLGVGKTCAQVAHASLEAVEKTSAKKPGWVEEWKASGQAKVVLKVGSRNELLELFESAKKLLPCALIKDAGRTQIEAGEATCIAIGPAPDSEIDRFTSSLKLL
ncbi:MAG: peptidyl-tRNA hydrolase [Candidatus Diapherotrites archaeon]|nr:peptidyl-tRNA hydrolase [Candidatus Diapherotrites archaeon]